MKILLVCSAGMSTSMVVKRMNEEATARGLEAEIWAVGGGDAKTECGKADIVMLGPQIKYLEKQMKGNVNGEKPVVVINMIDYGRLDGKKILDVALAEIENFKKA